MLETIWNENWIWLSGYLVSLGRIVLVITGVILCTGILHKCLEEREIIRLIVMGVFLFLTEYILISAVLFQIDAWGITTTLLLEVLVNGGLYGQMSFRKGKSKERRRLDLSVRKYLPMFAVCAGALLLAHNINGYYGMQQDQGVYQTSAIAMIYGNGRNEKELIDYQKLLQEDYKKYMQVVPTAVNGFYFYDVELEGLYTKSFTSESSGYFHGIPTYPALLALWGGMFGLRFMGGIQVVFYILLLAVGYFFVYDLDGKKGLAALGCGVLAVSPMILWVAKSALTEMYLACALLVFLYFLTREEKAAIWLSAITIIGFGCIHLSLYTLMPVIILIYGGLYLRYNRGTYIGAGILATVGFWFSTNLTRVISTKYFYLNIEPLLSIFPWISKENVMDFITIICIAVIAIGILILRFRPHWKGTDKIEILSRFWGPWVVRLLIILWCVLTGIMILQKEEVIFSSALGYSVLAGVIMLPLGLIGILVRPQLLWRSRSSALLGVLFAYCVLLYSLVFRSEIPYYYYYGRYLVPFLPFVVWQGIQTLLLIKGRGRIAVCSVVVIAQALLIPYDLVLLVQRDDTRMNWELLEEINSSLTADDVLIIEDTLLNTCYLPLTFMSQAVVLPQMQGSPYEVMCRYASRTGETYYLSSGKSEIGQTYTLLRSSYTTSEDDQKGERGLLELPISIHQETEYLQLNRLNRTSYVYMAQDDCWINMPFDENGSRWGCGSEYGLSAYLDRNDYIVHLQQGAAIPLEIYGVEYYPVQVYINGRYLLELRIYQVNGTKEITFDIPADYIKAGENTLLFQSDPWSPQDFNEEDYKELGINISSIRFEAK